MGKIPKHYSMSGKANFRAGLLRGALARQAQADAWAKSILPHVKSVIAQGFTGYCDLAASLKQRGCKTRRGGAWNAVTAGKLYRRLVRLGLLEPLDRSTRYLSRRDHAKPPQLED